MNTVASDSIASLEIINKCEHYQVMVPACMLRFVQQKLCIMASDDAQGLLLFLPIFQEQPPTMYGTWPLQFLREYIITFNLKEFLYQPGELTKP